MNRKRILNLFVSATVASSQMLAPLAARAQQTAADVAPPSLPEGARARVPRVVASYRADPALFAGAGDASAKGARQAQRPEWVEIAIRASVAHLKTSSAARGLHDLDRDLALFSASKDDRGNVDVRFAQLRDGVEVVDGQLISHVNSRGDVRAVTGGIFDTTGAESVPLVDAAGAIEAARSSVEPARASAKPSAPDASPTEEPAPQAGPRAARSEPGTAPPGAPQKPGRAQLEPAARMAILPRAVATGDRRATGATLVFRVTLRDANAPGSVDVFVDARTGAVLLTRNNFAAERGIGYTLYDGRITIGTTPMTRNRYRLRDPERGNSETWDALGANDGSGKAFVDRDDDVWGDGTTNSRQTVGVSAQFGVQEAWDFYVERYGRVGADGAGTGITALVYYDVGLNNAFGGGNQISIGMGDGVMFGPLVSLDVIGHEFTHSVVEATAGLSSQYEGGAINESMCDIFGNASEAHSDGAPNFLVGEDCYTPATPGDAMRDMANPTIDHMSKLKRLGAAENPSDDNDNGYVHENSGIMSNAFYLLAAGGTNATSGMSVPAIGREAAEDIFYTALTGYMFPGTDYVRAANSTLGAASDLYGYDSTVYRAVDRAWHAVGVLVDAEPPADTTERKLLFYSAYDGSGSTAKVSSDRTFESLVTYQPGSFGAWWWVIGDGTDVFYYNGETGAAAVGNVDAVGNHITTKVWPANTFRKNWTTIVRHKGSLLFYNEYDGVGAVGRLTGPQGFTQYNQWTTFSRGWTTITSVQDRLMFYNRNTGLSAVGDLVDVVEGAPGQFPTLKRIDFRQDKASYFAPGWTNIVDTGHGILFYNSDTGAYAVGDLDASGNYADRVPGVSPGGHPTWAYSNIGAGWTSVTRLKDTLIFYNFEDGSTMTARMRGTAGIEYEIDGEPLVPCQRFTLDQYISNIVCTVDPPLPPG